MELLQLIKQREGNLFCSESDYPRLPPLHTAPTVFSTSRREGNQQEGASSHALFKEETKREKTGNRQIFKKYASPTASECAKASGLNRCYYCYTST